VKESVTSAIAALSDTAEELILPFYEEAVPFFFKMLETHQANEYKKLRGHIIECLTMMAHAVKWDKFQKYANHTIDIILQIQVIINYTI
jgi:hypothetical protein